SVQFWINGALAHTEYVSPYCSFGDPGTACTRVQQPAGSYTVQARVLRNGTEVARQAIVINATGVPSTTGTTTTPSTPPTTSPSTTPTTSPSTTPTTSPSTTPPTTSSRTTASLSWTPPTNRTDVAGYNVYVGTASGVYGPPINAGNVTSYVVNNLVIGNTYFFFVTDYNASGVESPFSNEVSKSIY